MSRRRLLVLAAAVLGLAAVTATGGFTSASVERSVQVQVADDENAYLGFEQNVTNVENGSADLEVRISNRFGTATDLATVEVTVDGTAVDLAGDGPIGPGETVDRTFRSVPCDDSISIAASGDGVAVRFDRIVSC